MFSFLKASPPAPRIESSRTDAEYKKLRWQVFAGVFIGYAAYYLIRKNFSLAIPYLIDEYGFTKADLGTVGVALSLAYGFSKFIMGNISDRSNPKYFITIGLLGSALVSLIFRFSARRTILYSIDDCVSCIKWLVPRNGISTRCKNNDQLVLGF